MYKRQDVDCPALQEHCAIMKERRNACALQSAKELEQLYPCLLYTSGLIWPLFSTALFFLVFVGALTLLFNWAEKKLDYFRC